MLLPWNLLRKQSWTESCVPFPRRSANRGWVGQSSRFGRDYDAHSKEALRQAFGSNARCIFRLVKWPIPADSCVMGKSTTPSLFSNDDDPPSNSGRDELNFAEFPMALLTERAIEGKNKLVFSDTVRDSSSGMDVRRQLTVAAPDMYGLPTVKDEEVLLGVLALTKRKSNFSDATVEFSRRELLTVLGWPDQGHYYQRIIASLNCWASVFLHYENAWWDNERKEWLDVSFHVFDSVVVAKPQKKNQPGRVMVQWGKTAFQSFGANYLKQIDLGFYQSLESATAKRLYRYLDKHFYRRARLEYDLATLAYEHIGLSRDYEAWKVKQKLAPAIAELEGKGYLEALSPKERYLPAGKGKWRVVFTRKVKELREAKPSEPAIPESPHVEELVRRGVHPPVAATLVAATPEDKLLEGIEAFDWLVAKKDKRVSKNPPGFLVESIKGEFPHPPGFVPAAVKKAKEEAQRKKRLDEARKRRDDESKMVTGDAEWRTRIDGILAAMPKADCERFVEEALSNRGSFIHERYHDALKGANQAAAERYRYMLLDQALRAQGEQPSTSA